MCIYHPEIRQYVEAKRIWLFDSLNRSNTFRLLLALIMYITLIIKPVYHHSTVHRACCKMAKTSSHIFTEWLYIFIYIYSRIPVQDFLQSLMSLWLQDHSKVNTNLCTEKIVVT